MRQINIKLNGSEVLSVSSRNIGFYDEHNATELIIEIPDNLISDSDCFMINFDTGKRTILSPIITESTKADGAWIEDNKIHCIVWQELTEGEHLSFTVDCCKYVGTDTIEHIVKLPLVDGLLVRKSISGNNISSNEVKGIVKQAGRILAGINSLNEDCQAALKEIDEIKEEVNSNSEERHNHPNKELLDRLSDSDFHNHVNLELLNNLDESDFHSHDNMKVLEAISAQDGQLLLNGVPVYGDHGTLEEAVEAIDGIKILIPSDATSENQLADKTYVDEEIKAISEVIPDEASADNKLADKTFVGQAITDTAPRFLGFRPLQSGYPSNPHPYDSFCQIVNSGNRICELVYYIYQESGRWTQQHTVTLNDVNGIAALNSTITQEKVSQYDSAKQLIDSLDLKIPEEASPDNQLADKAYVNDSIKVNSHELTSEQQSALDSGITESKVKSYDETVVATDGYNGVNGIPEYNERELAYKKNKVVPINFTSAEPSPVNLIIRSNWHDIERYAIKSYITYTTSADGEVVYELGFDEGMTSLYGKCLYCKNTSSDETSYLTEEGTWKNVSTKKIVEAPNLSSAYIQSFECDYGVLYESEYYYSYPDVGIQYDVFCKMVNVTEKAMGDILDEHGLCKPIYFSGTDIANGNAKPDTDYIVSFDDIVEIAEINLDIPDNMMSSNAQISLTINKDREDIDVSITSTNTSGQNAIYLYNGQPIDLTETGYYRVIATWNPQCNAWCLACAKMEDAA